ncbi:MAG: monovalent cation/H(+) antiporter subunit G [Bordetella sp.]|nr:MAG: monovalent cation/H(+) antiporter subunit G [Bordetella sp.]
MLILISFICSFLLILGGSVTLLGSIGLLFFSNFYIRIHMPMLASSIGAICILLSFTVFSFYVLEKPIFHIVTIITFMIISSPITTTLIMRAAIYRTIKKDTN